MLTRRRTKEEKNESPQTIYVAQMPVLSKRRALNSGHGPPQKNERRSFVYAFARIISRIYSLFFVGSPRSKMQNMIHIHRSDVRPSSNFDLFGLIMKNDTLGASLLSLPLSLSLALFVFFSWNRSTEQTLFASKLIIIIHFRQV